MAKKKQEIIVSTAKPQRKKTVPKTAFKKGNTFGFKKGESGRTRKAKDTPPDDMRLVSRALRVSLGHRAPDERAKMVGLKPGSSWAQIVAQALMLKASEGDVQAIREVREGSEGGRNFGIGVGIHLGDAGEPGSEQTPMLRVIFTTPEFQELAKESGFQTELAASTEPPVLDGKALTLADADPELAAAREEARRAAQRRAEAADDEETEAASDGEPESKAETVQEQEQEQALPPLPKGFEYWPRWKCMQYRSQRRAIPANVIEMP